MKSKTSAGFYRRITAGLVMCIVVAVCVELYLTLVFLKKTYTVDFRNRIWLTREKNNSYRDANRSPIHKYTFKMLRINRKGQKTTLQSVALVTKADTEAVDRRSSPYHLKAKTTSSKNSINSAIRYSNSSEPNIHSKNIHITNNDRNRIIIQKQLNHSKMISMEKFISEDLMKQGPLQFLKNYKTPCWKPSEMHELTESNIHCLPYFHLIGAPKSGTTDLYERLIQHPDISELVMKELHWLTRGHYYAHRNQGGCLTDYLKLFNRATMEIYLEKDANGYHGKIFGDCSASTMWDNDYWTRLPEYRNRSEPLYTNADYIYNLNPNAKIIAMIRNPVERLYSDFLYFLHGSKQMFHDGTVKAIHETHECLKNNTLRHCLYTPPKRRLDFVENRLRIGVYHLHLKEYLRVFPREQVMVIKLEDFSKNTVLYMHKIFAFLEISELNEEHLQRIGNSKEHANRRRKMDMDAGEMMAETRRLLEAFYHPHNELLSELMGEQFNYNKDKR